MGQASPTGRDGRCDESMTRLCFALQMGGRLSLLPPPPPLLPHVPVSHSDSLPSQSSESKFGRVPCIGDVSVSLIRHDETGGKRLAAGELGYGLREGVLG